MPAFALLALAIGATQTAGAEPEIAASAARGTATTTAAALQQSRLVPYPFEHVWPTTIRYLRVDRGFQIRDRDQDAGYILFEFDSGRTDDGQARKAQGSLELLRTADGVGRPSVQLVASTSDGPVHLPHALLDGITAKLRSERGAPAPPPPPAPPPDKQPPAAPPKKDEAPPEEPDDGLPPMVEQPS